MTKRFKMSIWVCLVAVAVGCGGKDKSEPAPEATAKKVAVAIHPLLKARDFRPDYFQPENPYARITPQLLDSLRFSKEKHHITRDLYWEGRGGVLANDFFEVWYPAGRMTVTHGMHVFNLLMPAQARFADFLGDTPSSRLVIYTCADIEEFEKHTGRGYWFHSEIYGDSMYMQPVWLFAQRKIDQQAIPYEYYQWAVAQVTRNGAPRWLEEGLAGYLSRSRRLLTEQVKEFPHTQRPTLADLNAILLREDERSDSRAAYYHCFKIVQKLVDAYGEATLADAVRNIAGGTALEEAFERAYAVDFETVMRIAQDYALPWEKGAQPSPEQEPEVEHHDHDHTNEH